MVMSKGQGTLWLHSFVVAVNQVHFKGNAKLSLSKQLDGAHQEKLVVAERESVQSKRA